MPAGAPWSVGHVCVENGSCFKEAFPDYCEPPKKTYILRTISQFCGRTRKWRRGNSIKLKAPHENMRRYTSLAPRCITAAPMVNTDTDLASLCSEPLPICYSSVFTEDFTRFQMKIKMPSGTSTKDHQLSSSPSQKSTLSLNVKGKSCQWLARIIILANLGNLGFIQQAGWTSLLSIP